TTAHNLQTVTENTQNTNTESFTSLTPLVTDATAHNLQTVTENTQNTNTESITSPTQSVSNTTAHNLQTVTENTQNTNTESFTSPTQSVSNTTELNRANTTNGSYRPSLFAKPTPSSNTTYQLTDDQINVVKETIKRLKNSYINGKQKAENIQSALNKFQTEPSKENLENLISALSTRRFVTIYSGIAKSLSDFANTFDKLPNGIITTIEYKKWIITQIDSNSKKIHEEPLNNNTSPKKNT
ncbi:MAG: hypothetical protein QG556_727, partial [Pseudomonadota bacterium]|nr:hypothetical protein [Pseudomonadota bacterium]